MQSLLNPVAVQAPSTTPYVRFQPYDLWPSTSFVTEDLSAPRLYSATLGEADPGLIFIAPFGNGSETVSPTILTDDGKLVWQHEANQEQPPDFSYANFDVQKVFGKDHLTYWSGTLSGIVGAGYGNVTILDHKYQVKYTICGSNLGLNSFTGQNEPCQLDAHESFVTPSNTLLSTAYSVITTDLSSVGGGLQAPLLDSLWVEIDIQTQKILRRWSAFEHLKTFPLSSSHNPYSAAAGPYDFFHINAVSTLGSGYLVSSRDMWEIFYINQHGSIEWILNGETGGDFVLPSDARFRWQHHVRGEVISDTEVHIHMFDNNDGFPGGGLVPSSGLLLSLDLQTFTVRLLRRLTDRHVTVNSWHTGSYQPLGDNGHVLVNYGQPPILQEYDRHNKLVWEGQYGTQNGVDSYRAFKRKWHGRPETSPKLVAKKDQSASVSMTSVWVSWNGATDIASWAFWAGHAESALRMVKKVAKDDFEVHVQLQGIYRFVQAEALANDGSTLGFTSIVTVEDEPKSSRNVAARHDEL